MMVLEREREGLFHSSLRMMREIVSSDRIEPGYRKFYFLLGTVFLTDFFFPSLCHRREKTRILEAEKMYDSNMESPSPAGVAEM